MANVKMNGVLKLAGFILTALIVFASIVYGYATLKSDVAHIKEGVKEGVTKQEALNVAVSETVINTEKIVIRLETDIEYIQENLPKLLVETLGLAENVEIQTQNNTITTFDHGPTILSGSLQLPNDLTCRIYDITGKEVSMKDLRPGIYFIEYDARIMKKIVKIK